MWVGVNSIFQNPRDLTLEKLLPDLPTFCKFNKNGCRLVLDPSHIARHEGDCKYRNIYCPHGACYEISSMERLSQHLKLKVGLF